MKNWFYWHIQNPIWYFYHRNFMPKLRGDKPFILPLLNSKWWGKRFLIKNIKMR